MGWSYEDWWEEGDRHRRRREKSRKELETGWNSNPFPSGFFVLKDDMMVEYDITGIEGS